MAQVKSWLKHHFNCRKKSELSALIEVGGNSAYGIFWRLSELFGEMQSHRPNPCKTITISKTTLFRELGINERGYQRITQQFQIVGIRFVNLHRRIAKGSANLCRIHMPNSLIFMSNSNLILDNKSKSKSKIKSGRTFLDLNGLKEDEIPETSIYFKGSMFSIYFKSYKKLRFLYPDIDTDKKLVAIDKWMEKKNFRPKNISEFIESMFKRKRIEKETA